MKFKEAVKDTNASFLEFLTHDNWEIKLAFNLIKQGFRDVFSGIKIATVWILILLVIPFIPLLYIYAVIIRMVKK